MKSVHLAEKIGESYAETMFNDFITHPEYKGSKFTWENFPFLVARIAHSKCFMNFSKWDRLTQKKRDDLKNIAATAAIKRCHQLVWPLRLPPGI